MKRMVGFLLMVPLAFVHASDSALSKLECAHKKEKFCHLMKFARRMNDDVTILLKDENSFKDNMKTISYADEAIREVLSEENKTEVRESLRTALLLETSALEQLEFSCNGTNKEKEECILGMDFLFTAAYRLVDAAKEVAEESQLDAIKKADVTFKKRSSKKSYKDPALLYELVNETLEALEIA